MGKRTDWVEVACAACGTPIQRRLLVFTRSKTGRFFCSDACRDRVGAKPRKRPDSVCETCGKTFRANSGALGRFCSVPCHDEFQRRKRIERKCEQCGTVFWLRPSGMKHAARWCSKKCEGAAKRKRPLERMHNGKPVLQREDGYLLVFDPSFPSADKAGWVLEHRYVMEGHLGRTLDRDEHVHHVDGDKTNNDLGNLQVLGWSEHQKVHAAMK